MRKADPTSSGYATINNAYQVQTNLGFKAIDNLRVGLELVFSGNDKYRQGRTGMRVSGIPLGLVQLSLSAGGAHSFTDGRDAAYVGVDTDFAF
jgi:hypothetical protein